MEPELLGLIYLGTAVACLGFFFIAWLIGKNEALTKVEPKATWIHVRCNCKVCKRFK